MYTQEEKERLVKTARGKGAVGKNALVPKYVYQYGNRNCNILDYGCGYHGLHVKTLYDAGYNVFGYDFEASPTIAHRRVYNPEIYNWDIVYASNVLNVQPSIEHLANTIRELSILSEHRGYFYPLVIVNYPKSPRKCRCSVKALENLFLLYFKTLTILDKKNHVYLLTH